MNDIPHFAVLGNGEPIERARIPEMEFGEFRDGVLDAVMSGARVAALFADSAGDGGIDVYAVLADDAHGRLQTWRTHVAGKSFPSLTPECPQVQLFEREIAEQFGIQPEGHPWRKPVRFAPIFSGAPCEHPQIGVTDFYRVEGDEVHEVAVGPVHAGIIEPGHFRFQCHGENVLHLEISLGYQHRGVERALLGGPSLRTIHYMETLAGDTSVGHATAYCQTLESLAGTRVPARAQALRGIALELERIANHTGDLGALAGDVGFLPTQSYCGRLRGDFLNMTALICGSRFGRGLIRPGGIGFDLDSPRVAQLLERLAAAMKDVEVAVKLLWDSSSVMARFEDIGAVPLATCEELGLVGPAARACGAKRDIRQDLPAGIFRFSHIPVSTWNSGDVFARSYVRWLEIQQSAQFIQEQLQALPGGPIRVPMSDPAPNAMVTSLVEGWRGEVCHVALTDERGRFQRYKVVDSSFHNWPGLAMALRGQQISDFPLCNKSFNLSYCGHDL